MTKLDGGGNWVHTNVSAGEQMIATYKNDGLSMHFRLPDWLAGQFPGPDRLSLGQPEDT